MPPEVRGDVIATTTTTLDVQLKVIERSGIEIRTVRVWDSTGWTLELEPPLNPGSTTSYVGVAKAVDKDSLPLTIEVTDCDLHGWLFYFTELETSCRHSPRRCQR